MVVVMGGLVWWWTYGNDRSCNHPTMMTSSNKHFPRYWPFVRGIHRSPVNSKHKGQWRGALMFSLIYVWINGWVNNGEAGDLRRYRTHYDVTVMHRIGHTEATKAHILSRIRLLVTIVVKCWSLTICPWSVQCSRKVMTNTTQLTH